MCASPAPIPHAVELGHRAVVGPDPELPQARPVQDRWWALEAFARVDADHTLCSDLATPDERAGDRGLILASATVCLPIWDPLLLEALVDPGDEQEIPSTGEQGAESREELVSERIPDAAKSKLVEGAFVAEEVDDLHHPAPLRLRMIEPREGRGHRGVTPILGAHHGREYSPTSGEPRYGVANLVRPSKLTEPARNEPPSADSHSIAGRGSPDQLCGTNAHNAPVIPRLWQQLRRYRWLSQGLGGCRSDRRSV